MIPYRNRRAKVAVWLAEQDLDAVLFEDTEDRRSQSIRYLTGQPGDALCVILRNGTSYLVAWDINMAKKYGDADEILSYSDFERLPARAFSKILEMGNIREGARVEIPGVTSYPSYIDYVEELVRWDPVCRHDGADSFVANLRSRKDASEIEIYGKVSLITNSVMDEIEKRVRKKDFTTEADCSLFIERSLREHGCESTGFETLCAGPERSFGIHCFPSWTAAPFAAKGMSILDFGIQYDGYTSDVTMTFVRGPLSEKQKLMIALVEKASLKILTLCKPGTKTRDLALHIDGIFRECGMSMPHGLGHGIGLAAHEAPAIRSREDNQWVFEPGMVVAIEPGLYDPIEGGVRLENDFILTETACEILTKSRIVRL